MPRSRRDDLGDELVALLPALRGFTRRFEPDPVDAEDLVQDALVRAYERRATFKVGGNMRLWLLSIAAGAVIWRTRLHLLWVLAAGALLGALGIV